MPLPELPFVGSHDEASLVGSVQPRLYSDGPRHCCFEQKRLSKNRSRTRLASPQARPCPARTRGLESQPFLKGEFSQCACSVSFCFCLCSRLSLASRKLRLPPSRLRGSASKPSTKQSIPAWTFTSTLAATGSRIRRFRRTRRSGEVSRNCTSAILILSTAFWRRLPRAGASRNAHRPENWRSLRLVHGRESGGRQGHRAG